MFVNSFLFNPSHLNILKKKKKTLIEDFTTEMTFHLIDHMQMFLDIEKCLKANCTQSSTPCPKCRTEDDVSSGSPLSPVSGSLFPLLSLYSLLIAHIYFNTASL